MDGHEKKNYFSTLFRESNNIWDLVHFEQQRSWKRRLKEQLKEAQLHDLQEIYTDISLLFRQMVAA